MRHVPLILLLLVVAAMWSASPAGAAGVFRVGWDGCADDRASLQRCYTCDGHAGAPFVFQGSFRPANSIPDFAGCSSTVQITFQDADGIALPLPDFWRVATGECAAGRLVAVNPTVDGGCETPSIYPADAGGGFRLSYQGYPIGSTIRIALDWARPDVGGALVAGQLYPAFALSMDADGSIAAGCAGCSTRATIQLLKVEVFGWTCCEDEVITTPENRDWILWQDSSAYPCLSTPVRASSWGAIKAMYR